MSKKGKTAVLSIVIILVIGFLFGIVFISKVIPPGEEWISYQNDEVIQIIDAQLQGIDMESVVKEKSGYIVEKSIHEIQQEVEKGNLSYEEITAVCLYRIKTMDQKENGLNSVITINPDAMEEARNRDREYRRDQGSRSELYGIPVMLKDNINTAGMATSAGAEAFADFYPEKDAEVVKNLKENGAVILGKNNLSEFANYLSRTMPAGYSGRKGQTVNPFGPLKLSPSGSSGGSAVAVTANLVPVSVGTETDGSIIAPAAANSVVGLKPTRKEALSEGVFPLIKQIDTVGTIAKSVRDAAIAYQAMSGEKISLNFERDALRGKKIGVVGYEYNDKNMLSELRENLQSMGANVENVELDSAGILVFNNIFQSFKNDFEEYAENYDLPIKKLDRLLKYNREKPGRRIRYGQDLLEEAAQVENPDKSIAEKAIQKANGVLTALFQENQLDAFVFLNSSGTTVPAAAGYPELTVPFGTGKGNAPQGVTFVAESGEDEKLLNMGYSFEAHTQGRRVP